jgi:hypothetical protein
MSDDNARLVGLARAISDGVGVDWAKAGREAANAEETERIRELMQLEAVVAAHRALQSSTPRNSWGPLELIETIGRGAYGEVFLARDPRLDRTVALKLLHADVPGGASVADAVIEEGRLMARVRHPNVVTIYGAERHDNRVGLWMELIQGQPLSQMLEQHGVLGPREAGLIGLDLCRALAAVHHAGLVHQDVKAQNVMREQGGRIVLMDFSAGRDTRSGASSIGVDSGTPLYMPPEVFNGTRPDHRGDIYSLGVLLFHLVTGSFPVVAETVDGLRQAHLRHETQPLAGLRPDLPPAFVRVVEKALSYEPQSRFESAAAMEQALAAALGVEGGEATSSRVQLPRSFTLTAMVLTSATLLAVALATWVVLRPAAPRDVEPARASAPVEVPAQSQPAPAAPPAATAETPALKFVPNGAYTIEASLLRGAAAPERMESGERVRVGDALSMRLKVSRPVWLYVVDEDDQGVATLLFPLKGSDVANPIPTGDVLLPGRIGGEQKYWQVTSAGGREHFLVVASPKQLREFESETASLTRPTADGAGDYVVLSEKAKAQLRGIAGIVSGTAPTLPASGGRLFEIAKDLEARSEVVLGAWVRRIDLDNPVP